MTRIDAHQHYWRLDRGDYDWLTPDMTALYRDYLPADLQPELEQHGIGGTVLIQAAASEAETDYLLQLADAHPQILGVVGWIDLDATNPRLALSRFAAHRRFCGIRPMLQDQEDIGWLLAPRLAPTFAFLCERGLTFDALIRPHQIGTVQRLGERYPALRLVIDHGAKPDIAGGAWQPWAEDMARLAAVTGASVKLSGLLTEADDPAAVRRYADHLLHHFGPERLIWGSDWPVLLTAAGYGDWLDQALAWLPQNVAAIFGGNAAAFYRLETP